MKQTGQTASLSNKTILITRPAGREKNLYQLIEHAGGQVIHYPVIEIQQPSDSEIANIKRLHEQINDFTIAIFISRTSVEQSRLFFPVLPDRLTIVSIGSKTTESLERNNIHVDIEAPDHNTESLLQTAEFQSPDIQGQKILIFRGKGGRGFLGDTLKQRGAEVTYVEIYKRVLPSLKPLSAQQICSIDAITISSNEGLNNLVTLMQGTEQIIDIPLVLPSRRAAALAREYGFKNILTAKNATDEAVLSTLNNYFSA